MQLKTQTNRISWIDMAKGYGTILVIYAHLGVGSLWTLIYSFHLPLFFFLSGYVFSTKDNFINFLAKKFKSLIIPYFCMGLLMIGFELLRNMRISGVLFTATDVIHYIKLLVFQQRFWTLWFMACLFCLNLLFYILVKTVKKLWLIIPIAMVLPIVGLHYYQTGGTPIYWNVDTCLMAIPFFTCGYICKLYSKRINTILDKTCWNIPLFILFAIMNIVAWQLSLDETNIGLEMFDSNYGNPLFTYIAAFAGIFCVVILSRWFTLKPIRYIGENSMIYYTLHQTIMIPVMYKIMSIIKLDTLLQHGELGLVLYKWICLIGIVIGLTIFNWCIKKTNLKFIVGKYNK